MPARIISRAWGSRHSLGVLKTQPGCAQDTAWVVVSQTTTWEVVVSQTTTWEVVVSQTTTWEVVVSQTTTWEVVVPELQPGRS